MGYSPWGRKEMDTTEATYLHQYSYLEISWIEEPDGLQSMGSKRVGHDLVAETTVLAEDDFSAWQLLFMVPCGLLGLSWVTTVEAPRDW